MYGKGTVPCRRIYRMSFSAGDGAPALRTFANTSFPHAYLHAGMKSRGYLRHAKPEHPRANAQAALRANLGKASSAFKNKTQVQVTAWANYAAVQSRPPRQTTLNSPSHNYQKGMSWLIMQQGIKRSTPNNSALSVKSTGLDLNGTILNRSSSR